MKMKRILLILGSVIVVGLVIYAILFNPEPITYPFLIGDEDCRPPCWMGIIPGETLYDEAISIVEKLPFVNDRGFMRVSEDYQYIGWSNGEVRSVSIYLSNNIVEFINIGLEGINLGSVVALFGEPAGYAYSTDSYSCEGYSISLFYPNLGVVFPATQRLSGSVSKSMIVHSAFFLSPMGADEFPSFYFDKLDTILYRRRSAPVFSEISYDEWEGFGRYPKELDSKNRYSCILMEINSLFGGTPE